MQTEYSFKIPENAALPPALPPAPPKEAAAPARRRGTAAAQLLCIFFAAVALFVMTASAVQKIDEIMSAGIWNFAAEELLCLDENASLGDRISETAFGSPKLYSDIPSLPDVSVKLPRIYYVPKEKIADSIFTEKEETDTKTAELYSFDIESVPADAYPIVPTDLAAKNETDIKNETSFSIDVNSIAKDARLLQGAQITSEPLVLIVHTHGTESYAADGAAFYNDEINYPRSEDVSKNIVAVGKVLADKLNEAGIPTIHCETMHDKDSYIKAYERSAESIQYYLEKYPSIKYVFDVHRDSLIRSDLTKLKPVALYGGEACAQVMMIVGSNEKGAGEYDWESNLVLAEAIQQNLFEGANGVARQIYLRGATYNQQYAQHGILVEIGSCGNTLSEAKNAATAFADAFAKVVKEK